MSSTKSGNKTKGRKTVSTKRAKTIDQFFGKPAFKRLCYAAGFSTVGKELYGNVLIATDQICYQLLRSACASSTLAGRKTLNENDLAFACQANKTPLLSSAVNIKRIKIKKAGVKKENGRNTSRNVLSANKIRYYQKESVGTIMFSSTPFVRKFKEMLSGKKDELIFASDELPRMTKNFKILLQLTVQTILVRILSDAFLAASFFGRKSVTSALFKHTASNYFGGKINF